KHYIPEATKDNYIGKWMGANRIVIFDPDVTLWTFILVFPEDETFLNFSSLGIFLRICTDKNTYTLKWNYDNEEYDILPDITMPKSWFTQSKEPVSEIGVQISDTWELYSSHLDSLVAAYIKDKSDKKKKGMITGHIIFRLAFKLWDGTYMKHTAPIYAYFGETDGPGQHDEMLLRVSDPDDLPDILIMTFMNISYSSPILHFYLTNEQKEELEPYRELIKEVVVFATGEVERYKLSNSAGDYGHFYTGTGGPLPPPWPQYTQYMLYTVSKDDKLKESFPENNAYYRIHSIPFSELLLLDQVSDIEIDLGDFTTIETREVLPIDDFTHHKLISNADYVYNQRLHIGDITTKFGVGNDPTYIGESPVSNYTYGNGPLNRAYYVEWTLQTDKGIKYVRERFSPTIFDQTTDMSPANHLIFLGPFFGYPDNRATALKIYCKELPSGTDWHIIAYHELKPHPLLNLAYCPYYNDAYNIFYFYSWIVYADISLHPITTVEDVDDLYIDTNRVQVSNQNNLLLWPAKYSYQVHNEDVTVIGITSQSQPLSEGQFGQFPLYIFTTNGIWYMVQGSGLVLYERTLPLNKEVAIEGSVLSLGDVVLYATGESVKVLSGREPVSISDQVEGDGENLLKGDTNYGNYVNNSDKVEVLDYLSAPPGTTSGVVPAVTFQDYLQGAIIGYDHVNQEVIISNSAYKYSYVYNKESKVWHKVAQSYDQFVISPTGNIGIDGDNAYLIESDDENNERDCFIQTRPFSFKTNSYKRIKRLIMRLRSTPHQKGKNHFLLLYGSVNGSEYKLLQGIDTSSYSLSQMLLRQAWVSCRYFIIVWGVKSSDAVVEGLEVEAVISEAKKIR
ncbi:MAG: hypothetical protein DRP42_05835, partial [Tenericutes bacterium]